MGDDRATWSMGDPGTSPVADGERYRVSGEIGRGAMGRVLLAWDTLLDREVAIKEVLPGALPGTVRRFLAEARLTAGLQHPGIVPVYDAGERPDGTLYYVMKRVRGQTLEGRLATCPDIESRLRLLDRVVAVCQAVAHGRSIARASRAGHSTVRRRNTGPGEA